jgi:hypothetical protein
MPINDVMQFIKRLQSDKGFRDYLFSFQKSEQVQKFVADSGFRFTVDEFYQTYDILIFKCQEYEDALLLNDVCNSFLCCIGMKPLSSPIS